MTTERQRTWTVWYLRPENRLNSIPADPGAARLTREQAIKLIESFTAAGTTAVMDEDETHNGPIEIPRPTENYFTIMGRTSRKLVEEAVSACGGNQTKAAKQLGMPRTTLTSILRHPARDFGKLKRTA